MIFSDVILGWYYNNLGQNFVMIIGKQTSYWSKTGFFFLSLPVKKVNDNEFSSQFRVTSSQNNVQNYHTTGHEQV